MVQDVRSFETRRQAVEYARALRALGKTVRVYRREALYTQPGRGFRGVSVTYEVREVEATEGGDRG